MDKLIRKNRDAILSLARKHGAEKIKIFGSRARDDARPDSDVDFLIEAGSDISPFFPGGLLFDLQELLRCNVHVMEKDGLHFAIRERVLKEAVLL
jgi:hypothetical protein